MLKETILGPVGREGKKQQLARLGLAFSTSIKWDWSGQAAQCATTFRRRTCGKPFRYWIRNEALLLGHLKHVEGPLSSRAHR